jgi:hypothetical protein
MALAHLFRLKLLLGGSGVSGQARAQTNPLICHAWRLSMNSGGPILLAIPRELAPLASKKEACRSKQTITEAHT